MPIVTTRPGRSHPSGSASGIRSIAFVAVAGIVAAFIPTGLLALNIDEYRRYSAATQEHGALAAAHADEALFGLGVSAVLLTVVWLLVIGIAATIAAGSRLPVIRTVGVVGGGLLLLIGAALCLGVTVGTVPIGQLT